MSESQQQNQQNQQQQPRPSMSQPSPSSASQQSGGPGSGQGTGPSERLPSQSSHGQQQQGGQQQQQQARPNADWQSHTDMPDRREMILNIYRLLNQNRNASQEWLNNLPQMVKHFEVSLYRSAPSLEAYADTSTLKHRLQLLVVDIARRRVGARQEDADEGLQQDDDDEEMQDDDDEEMQDDDDEESEDGSDVDMDRIFGVVGSLPYLIHSSRDAVDWDAVIRRARSHSAEAYLQPDRGYSGGIVQEGEATILHRVLIRYRPPVEAVAAILDAFPGAVDRQYRDLLPFHYACGENHEYQDQADFGAVLGPQSPEVIRLVLRRYLDALRRDGLDDNPICHFNWDRTHPDAATTRALLEEFPEGATKVRHYGEKIDAGDPSPFDLMMIEDWVDSPDDILDWEKVRLLLTAAEHGTIDLASMPGRTLHPVQTVLRRIFHPEVIDIVKTSGRDIKPLPLFDVIKANAPASFRDRDDGGALPVHLALENDRNDHLSPFVKFDLIGYLLAEHPQAASIPNIRGQLPLILAAQNNWPWRLVLGAAPQVISTRDVATGLYPFQLAACRASEGGRDPEEASLVEMKSVEVSFLLLLEHPSVLSRYIPVN